MLRHDNSAVAGDVKVVSDAMLRQPHEFDKAAAGGDATDVAIALRMVLMLENVEYCTR